MKSKKCFVIMPSGNHKEYKGGKIESDFIFEKIIVPSVERALGKDVEIIKETDNLDSGAINRSIVTHTATADFVIVDITGNNPNVFFELGMRYVFKPSTTILLKQKKVYIPFDISNYRCIEYGSKYFDPEIAINKISEALEKANNDSFSKKDSLVYDVYPNLLLSLDAEKSDNEHLSWAGFWNRITIVTDILKKKPFNPNCIIGISNGGMFLADTLGRLVYPEIPTLSLWANRNHSDIEYFDNEFNRSVVEAIKKKFERPRIIVCDDVVASGTTYNQVKRFLKKFIVDFDILFIPLFCKQSKTKILEESIWGKPEYRAYISEGFNISTAYIYFPYDKEINISKK
jgi:hypoxanthine phosphoribosyltransferase